MVDVKKGIVDWYNSTRGYGVILGEDNEEYFLHCTKLPPNLKNVCPNMHVIFESISRPKNKGGFEAINIMLDELYEDKQKKALIETNTKKVMTPNRKPKLVIQKNREKKTIDVDYDYWYQAYSNNSQNQKKSSEPKYKSEQYFNLEPNEDLLYKRQANDYIIEKWEAVYQPQKGNNCEDECTQRLTRNIQPDATRKQNSLQTIQTKVVGVTFDGRQSIIELIEEGDEISLVREPKNNFDKNAIKVIRENGDCFGYINRFLAENLAVTMDQFGYPLRGKVIEITGANVENSNSGVIIEVNIPDAY